MVSLNVQVSVLKGGDPAWLHAGYAVTTEIENFTPGDFVANANENLISTEITLFLSHIDDSYLVAFPLKL